MRSKSRRQLFVAIDSTNPTSTSALSIYSSVLTSRAPTTPPSAYHARSRGVELTCSSSARPTSAHTPSMEHNIIASNIRPYPLSAPPSAGTRTPTPHGMLQRCRTGRTVDLMDSWLRSKGVSPIYIWLVRHARSAQAASTNLSMPTTTPPIRL